MHKQRSAIMKFLQQPFPHDASLRGAVRTSAGFAIFIFVFLLIFRPFNMDSSTTGSMVLSCAIFGAVTFIGIFTMDVVLDWLFPNAFNEKNWTVGKQILNILLVLLLIGTLNFLAYPLLFDAHLNWRNFTHAMMTTVTVGIVPITIYTLYKQNIKLKQFRQEAAVLQEKLQEKKQADQIAPVATIRHNIITFAGENNNEKFSVDEQELVYLESASNYVKVFFEKNGRLNYTIIRSTMKKMEETLQDHSLFFRCHRAYVINLEKIVSVEGNAQGYKLRINGSEELVPVSRNLNKEFSDRLLAVRGEIGQ